VARNADKVNKSVQELSAIGPINRRTVDLYDPAVVIETRKYQKLF
jgi:hypothetical protein